MMGVGVGVAVRKGKGGRDEGWGVLCEEVGRGRVVGWWRGAGERWVSEA